MVATVDNGQAIPELQEDGLAARLRCHLPNPRNNDSVFRKDGDRSWAYD